MYSFYCICKHLTVKYLLYQSYENKGIAVVVDIIYSLATMWTRQESVLHTKLAVRSLCTSVYVCGESAVLLGVVLFLVGCYNCHHSHYSCSALSNLVVEQEFQCMWFILHLANIFSPVYVIGGIKYMSLKWASYEVFCHSCNVVCLSCRTCSWSTGTIHQVYWEETSKTTLSSHSCHLFLSLFLYLSVFISLMAPFSPVL